MENIIGKGLSMLKDDHHAAIAAARAFIAKRARPDWHTVACVVVTASGGRYLALNVDTTLPRAGICAEAVAIGMAVAAEADPHVVFCGAVNHHGRVIPPCGVCRELLLDYAAEALIAVPNATDFTLQQLKTLIPAAYKAGQRRM
jgi:cytidine deaminase